MTSVKKVGNELIIDPKAIATIDQYKNHTDPTYVGPGTWSVIHQQAFAAQTPAKQQEFILFMLDVCQKFPCHVCSQHCSEYISSHPMKDFVNTVIDINGEQKQLGMFIWSWKFHNVVNSRLKKPIMSWETAYDLYAGKDSGVCVAACMASSGPDETANNDSTAMYEKQKSNTPITSKTVSTNISAPSLNRLSTNFRRVNY